MNKFIKIKMIAGKNGIGGSFDTSASFVLDNINIPFNVKVKIDTGCSVSVIPLAKCIPVSTILNKLKRNDINNNVNFLLSYGVESGGMRHKVPITCDDKMACEAMKFKHSIYNFSVGGVPINHNYIHINYDRKSNILIGMDILKDWDIHIGTINTGETIFLGCPKDRINDEYLQELDDTFNLSSALNAMYFRKHASQ